MNYVGVSNLFTFLKTIPPYWQPLLDMMYEMVGNPEIDTVQFRATSPALNAHKIITPLFVAQGANDPRVNKAESDQIVEALNKRGIEVEYMVKIMKDTALQMKRIVSISIEQWKSFWQSTLKK